MNRADLVRLRAAEEMRGLDRVWRLLGVARGQDLAGPRYGTLRSKYEGHRHDLDEMGRRVGEDVCDGPNAAIEGTGEFEREIFCYVIGRMLRAQPLDQGDQWVGAAADQLLAELARQACVTVPPITGLELELGWESLSPLIELVRLRFPGAGVWDLPILAHEFGHYLLGNPPAVDGCALRSLHRVKTSLATGLKERPALWRGAGVEEDDEQCLQRVEELMADVFATYALGPAYPQCCIALRVPLSRLDRRGDRHPPWLHRVTGMIETLHRMSQLARDNPSLGLAEAEVRELWQALSGDSGPELEDDDLELLRQWVDDITAVLHDVSGLMYAGGRAVDRIAYMLDVDAEGDQLPRGATVVQVLNAGWRWRLAGDRKTAVVEGAASRSLAYCRHIRKERDHEP